MMDNKLPLGDFYDVSDSETTCISLATFKYVTLLAHISLLWSSSSRFRLMKDSRFERQCFVAKNILNYEKEFLWNSSCHREWKPFGLWISGLFSFICDKSAERTLQHLAKTWCSCLGRTIVKVSRTRRLIAIVQCHSTHLWPFDFGTQTGSCW